MELSLNSLLGNANNGQKTNGINLSQNNTTSDPNIICHEFNNFFTNIGPNLAAKIPQTEKEFTMYLNRPTLNSIALSPIDGNEIVSIVHNLKNKPSTGYDQIGLDIIKKTIYSIIKPLSVIINQLAFDQRYFFPDALKIAQELLQYLKQETRVT